MKATIEARDRREADAIRSGLEDPIVRAYVTVIGVLNSLPTQRARERVMQYIKDRFEEEAADAARVDGGLPL